jgi:hypothetical protein
MLHLQPSNLIDIGGGGNCLAKIWSTLALAHMSIMSFNCSGWVSWSKGTRLALCPFTFTKVTSIVCSVQGLETIVQMACIRSECLYFVGTFGFPAAALFKPASLSKWTVTDPPCRLWKMSKETYMTTLEFRSVSIDFIGDLKSNICRSILQKSGSTLVSKPQL